MANKKKRKKCRGCEVCENANYIGEGDFVCYEGEDIPVMVISDFIPTDKYLACKGKYFIR